MHRKTTRELLAESFRELAAGKPIDKITIQDIVTNCGYAPATFYRHFRDKYDLIAWDYARRTAPIMEQVDGATYPWKQTLLDGARQFWAQREYLANLFRHTSGHDSFVRYMTQIHYDLLSRHITARTGAPLTEQETLYVRIYCLGTVGLTCEWLLGRYAATPEQIARVYEDVLPLPLHRYLL